MRLFLSYRRDDTGGRAGRLFDTLVTRYGRDDVFQDVNTVEPGLKFVQQVESAIRRSDVVLVVIGPGWISSPAPDGGRRIDQADDFVRRELSVALDADVRVVPVLVDGAVLPLAEDLPEGLVPLLERQAVSIRDVSWHEDVDALIRRLEGNSQTTARPDRRHLPFGGPVALGALIAVIAVAAFALTRRDGDEGSTSVEPPPCLGPQPSWTVVPLASDPSIQVKFGERSIRFEVEAAYLFPVENRATRIVVDLLVTNATAASVPEADSFFYYSYSDLDGLWVNGVASEKVACSNLLGDNSEIRPTQSVPTRVGFDTTRETDGASLQLVVADVVLAINSA